MVPTNEKYSPQLGHDLRKTSSFNLFSTVKIQDRKLAGS